MLPRQIVKQTKMDPNSVQFLSDLLKGPSEDQDKELDAPTSSPYVTPGSIGPPSSQSVPSGHDGSTTSPSSKDIWSSEEVPSQPGGGYDDPRPAPEYDMVFRQCVTPEDVFLGMGTKTPSTVACEALVVRIKLPNTAYKDVDLDVTEQYLDCHTPKYRLGLHLPHKVDHEHSKARWLSQDSELEVTLLLDRDYEFLNR